MQTHLQTVPHLSNDRTLTGEQEALEPQTPGPSYLNSILPADRHTETYSIQVRGREERGRDEGIEGRMERMKEKRGTKKGEPYDLLFGVRWLDSWKGEWVN